MNYALKAHVHSINLLVLFLLVFALSCDNVKNTSNFATIEGFVLTTNNVGVESVQVFVEADPSSPDPFPTRDIEMFTDADGKYEARVFLSFTTMGNEITDFTPRFLGDVRIVFFLRGVQIGEITGLTIQAGKKVRVPDVFLPVGFE